MDGMTDCDCLVFKINGIPLQTEYLTAAKAVKRCGNDTKFYGVALNNTDKVFDLLLIVELS